MINCDNDRYRTRMAYHDYGCLDYRKIEADFDEFFIINYILAAQDVIDFIACQLDFIKLVS